MIILFIIKGTTTNDINYTTISSQLHNGIYFLQNITLTLLKREDIPVLQAADWL